MGENAKPAGATGPVHFQCTVCGNPVPLPDHDLTKRYTEVITCPNPECGWQANVPPRSGPGVLDDLPSS